MRLDHLFIDAPFYIIIIMRVAVMIYTLMSLYMLIPVTPQLLDFLMPLNKSRPYKYLFDIDYSFDREVYYYPVLLHSYLTAVMTMSIMIVTDTSYMSLTQHACGLFAAIGYYIHITHFLRNFNLIWKNISFLFS